MSDFEKIILNKLLDKYEKSKLSKGGTKVTRSINLTTKDEVLKSYNDYNSYKYVEINDSILRDLEDKGFIITNYNNETFKSLSLKIENVDKIYKYLKREKPSNELKKIKEVLNKYNFENFVDEFINYVKEKVEKDYNYPKSYFNDSKQLDLILNIFTKLFTNEEEMKKRDFSAKYLGDSKLFESVQGKIIKIIKDFDGKDDLNDDDILAAYNITNNHSYALIKNNLIFQINNLVIDLNEFGYEFSLSDEMINNIKIIDSNIKKVITVENLTSFYKLKDDDALIIYLAGFHNHTKQNLLKIIFESYPNADYYHFGDIDAGGFWIFVKLAEKTKIPFKPYKMDKMELINKRNLKKLSEYDIKRLNKMLFNKEFSIFYDTINYMLEHNVKLEQEMLD